VVTATAARFRLPMPHYPLRTHQRQPRCPPVATPSTPAKTSAACRSSTSNVIASSRVDPVTVLPRAEWHRAVLKVSAVSVRV